MQLEPRRQKLRAIFEGEKCFHPASVYDPLSIRAAQDLGFEAAMFAGSIASLTALGAPDIMLLSLSELAAQTHRICRASDLPLIVDADHGFGNALNVKRTVEELESAGVACLSIEDTLLPKPFASTEMEFIDIGEGVGKMKAAIAGRQDNNLMILGRTSAVAINGVEDGIKRGLAYLDAGVDGLMFVGIKTRAELDSVARAIDAPLMLGGLPQEMQELDYLSDCGVRICLQGHQPFMAAVNAMQETLKLLKQGIAPSQLSGLASSDEINKLSRDEDYKSWQKEFLQK